MPEIPSAGGLLERIGKSLGFGPKRTPEAQATAAATPPPAGEEAKAPQTPFDVLRGAPAFVPTAESSDVPVNPASLLPPVPEEEWQRARLAVDTRGSTGEAMAAASEVPAPLPVPIPGGEPRDLDASEVAAMYRQTPTAPLAEAPAPVAAELPDWLTPPSPAALDLPDWMRPPASPAAEKSAPIVPSPTEVPPPDSSKEFTPDAGALYVPGVTSPTEASSPEAPAAEASAPPAEPETEKKSTEELLMESLGILKEAFGAIGENRLTSEAKRQALIAAAKSNHLITELPPAIQQIIYISRAVAAQDPRYGRLSFQRDMLAAIKAIREAPVIEGESK